MGRTKEMVTDPGGLIDPVVQVGEIPELAVDLLAELLASRTPRPIRDRARDQEHVDLRMLGRVQAQQLVDFRLRRPGGRTGARSCTGTPRPCRPGSRQCPAPARRPPRRGVRRFANPSSSTNQTHMRSKSAGPRAAKLSVCVGLVTGGFRRGVIESRLPNWFRHLLSHLPLTIVPRDAAVKAAAPSAACCRDFRRRNHLNRTSASTPHLIRLSPFVMLTPRLTTLSFSVPAGRHRTPPPSSSRRPRTSFGLRSSRTIGTVNEAGRGSPVRRYGAICCEARPMEYSSLPSSALPRSWETGPTPTADGGQHDGGTRRPPALFVSPTQVAPARCGSYASRREAEVRCCKNGRSSRFLGRRYGGSGHSGRGRNHRRQGRQHHRRRHPDRAG